MSLFENHRGLGPHSAAPWTPPVRSIDPSEGTVAWLDFEPEPDITGDGSGDPDKWILTIADGLGTSDWPEEVAVIVHRTCDGKYPIDGDLANKKRRNAQAICDALNDGHLGNLWKEAD